MGILEIHFHDSQFEWTFNPETDVSGSLPFGGESNSESDRAATGGGTSTSSATSKLRPVGLVALVVAGAIAFNRVRSRRARKTAETGDESGGRRLSLSRSK